VYGSGVEVSVAVGEAGAVSVGSAVSVGVAVAVWVAVEVKVGTKLLVGVGVGADAPTMREPKEQPSVPSTSMARTNMIEAVLRLMIYSSHITDFSLKSIAPHR
jgi:hypothetical protein